MFSTLKSNQSVAGFVSQSYADSMSRGFSRGMKRGGLIAGGMIGAGALAGYAMRRPMPGPVGSRQFNDEMRREMRKSGIKYG